MKVNETIIFFVHRNRLWSINFFWKRNRGLIKCGRNGTIEQIAHFAESLRTFFPL